MRTTLLLAAAAVLCACGESRPVAGASSSSVCPAGIQATFSSIDQSLFKVTCTACHNGAEATFSGGLDFSGDALTALVNVTAQNSQAQAGARPADLLRVKPGDPDNSLLYQKLLIGATPSPQYGFGMPLGDPGSVCQQARDAIRQWILAGAPRD